MIELKNQLRLTPQLILTPQLKLVLKVLQLNILELQDFLLHEVQNNPFLEIEYIDNLFDYPQRNPTSEEIKLNEEISSEETFGSSFFLWEEEVREDELNWENMLKAEENLTDYLRWQINLKKLSSLEKEIAFYIIGNLDEKGYLNISPNAIAKEFNVPVEKVEKVRNTIKSLDPVGIASLNIKECLLTQLEFMHFDKDTYPYILVKNHLEEIPKGIEYLHLTYGYDKEKLEEALEIIRQLEPYPARNYFNELPYYIQPDLIYYKDKLTDEWKVEIVKDMPFTIKLNKYYQKYYKSYKNIKDAKTKQFFKEKIKDAENLLKALDSRYTSLYKVGFAILKHQEEFLEKGVKFLKPLTFRILADEIGLHESTISRIVSNKYVQTPMGVYPLKFFFSSGYESIDGEKISAKAVKDYIKEIIKNEDPKKPLSDSKIAKILKEKYGINIARRTVTKYREELQIPSIRLRKKF